MGSKFLPDTMRDNLCCIVITFVSRFDRCPDPSMVGLDTSNIVGSQDLRGIITISNSLVLKVVKYCLTNDWLGSRLATVDPLAPSSTSVWCLLKRNFF